jgi:hypothetical protein
VVGWAYPIAELQMPSRVTIPSAHRNRGRDWQGVGAFCAFPLPMGGERDGSSTVRGGCGRVLAANPGPKRALRYPTDGAGRRRHTKPWRVWGRRASNSLRLEIPQILSVPPLP